jgi:hypothetical protein
LLQVVAVEQIIIVQRVDKVEGELVVIELDVFLFVQQHLIQLQLEVVEQEHLHQPLIQKDLVVQLQVFLQLHQQVVEVVQVVKVMDLQDQGIMEVQGEEWDLGIVQHL